MENIKKTAFLLLALVFLLSGCVDYAGSSVSESSDTSFYTSETTATSSEESRPDFESLKKDVIVAFESASEKETVFVDFLINRDIIEENNLETHDGEYPFVYYKLPEDHQFSTIEKITDYFSGVYIDVSSAIDSFFSYPYYGPSAMFVTFDQLVISDNYIGGDKFEIVPNSAKVTTITDNQATVSFKTVGDSFTTDITISLTDDGEWLLDDSLFLSVLRAEEAELIKSNWLDNITEGGMNSGSATTLTGSTLLINIFIDDGESEFDHDTVNSVLEYLTEAVDYLEDAASDYDSEIEIDFTDSQNSLFYNYDGIIPDDLNDNLWTNYIFGYDGVDALGQYLADNIPSSILEGYDNYGVLLHLNKQGRSYAMYCNPEYYDSNEYYTERAVMFYSTDFMYDYFICSSTYAHEILHLYGALDLYYPYDENSERADLANSYFWNELMRYTPADNINDATISKFTAFKIGLFPYLVDQLAVFDAVVPD